MAEEKEKEIVAYEVIFVNGRPTLSESVYYGLLHRGRTEEEIQATLEILSAHMVERGIKSSGQRLPSY